MNIALAQENPKISGAGVVAAGIVAALITWAAIHIAGIELEVGRDGDMSTVGAVDVVIASLVGGLAAWGVHTFMSKRGWDRWWPFVGSTALAISINGPGWFADGESAVALIVMHFVVAIVLITGLSLLSPSGRRRPGR